MCATRNVFQYAISGPLIQDLIKSLKERDTPHYLELIADDPQATFERKTVTVFIHITSLVQRSESLDSWGFTGLVPEILCAGIHTRYKLPREVSGRYSSKTCTGIIYFPVQC